jgi:hypothetical protein
MLLNEAELLLSSVTDLLSSIAGLCIRKITSLEFGHKKPAGFTQQVLRGNLITDLNSISSES